MTRTLSRRSALGLGLSLALAACGKRPSSSLRPRIVSLSPSTTEAIFAIGAGDLLVGRSRFCDYPPSVKALPSVGGFADPSVESIIALSPTLVVIARGPAGPALAEALMVHGIPTWAPETESIEKIEAMVTELGTRLGHVSEAQKVVADIEARRAEVRAAVANRKRVSALFLFGVSPIIAAGPGSFPDALLREAGGTNIVTSGGQYPAVDIERIITQNPEVILDGASEDHATLTTSRVSGFKDKPGWRELRALREGRVRMLSNSSVLRPGPRIGEGLVAMARALHGDDLLVLGSTPR